MKTKDFFGKFVNGYLLGNLLAMALVIGALCLGVKYGLEWYTHHGEGIKVPKIEGMSFTNARTLILEDNLNIMDFELTADKMAEIAKLDKGRKGKKALTRQENKIFVQQTTSFERYANVLEQLGFPI